MLMLKHHEESDSDFLSQVKTRMAELYKQFDAETSFVEYFQRHWGTDEKLSKRTQPCMLCQVSDVVNAVCLASIYS